MMICPKAEACACPSSRPHICLEAGCIPGFDQNGERCPHCIPVKTENERIIQLEEELKSENAWNEDRQNTIDTQAGQIERLEVERKKLQTDFESYRLELDMIISQLKALEQK